MPSRKRIVLIDCYCCKTGEHVQVERTTQQRSYGETAYGFRTYCKRCLEEFFHATREMSMLMWNDYNKPDEES